MFVARPDHVYFRHPSVEYRPTLSVDTRPISWPMIDRHLRRHSGEISTDTWSNVGRHVLHLVDRRSPGYRSIPVGHYRSIPIGRHLSVDTYRSTPIGRHLSVDTYRSTPIGRISTHTIGRHSADISADTRSTYRPILDRHIDWYFVERRSTCSSR